MLIFGLRGLMLTRWCSLLNVQETVGICKTKIILKATIVAKQDSKLNGINIYLSDKEMPRELDLGYF